MHCPRHPRRTSIAQAQHPNNQRTGNNANAQSTNAQHLFAKRSKSSVGKILKKRKLTKYFHKKSLKHNMGQGSSVEGLPTMGDLEKLTSCKLSTSTHMCSNILPVLFLSWNHLSVSMIIFSSNYTNEESIPWSLAGVHKLHLQALMCSWCPVESPMRSITMVWERAFHCR